MNPREAAFIAMLLPNPKKYSQSFREKKLTPFAEKRIREILKKMEMGRYLTEMQLDWSLKNRFSWEPEPYSEDTVWEDSDEAIDDDDDEKNEVIEEEKEEEKVEDASTEQEPEVSGEPEQAEESG